jgi:hypothetical protein
MRYYQKMHLKIIVLLYGTQTSSLLFISVINNLSFPQKCIINHPRKLLIHMWKLSRPMPGFKMLPYSFEMFPFLWQQHEY